MRRIQSGSPFGVLLAALLIATGSPSPTAAGPDRQETTVLLFPQPHYQGTPRSFTLEEGAIDLIRSVYDPQHPGTSRFGSIRVGRRVGVLLQEFWPDGTTQSMEVATYLADQPDLGVWKGHVVERVVIFLASVDGRRRGELERVREYPDGMELGRYRAASIIGGTNPRIPQEFTLSRPHIWDYEGKRLPNDSIGLRWGFAYAWLVNHEGWRWLRVYGAQTVVVVSSASKRWAFTTHGKPYAEYDLGAYVNLSHVNLILVGPRELKILPDDSTTGLLGAKAAARDYWVYGGGHFLKTTGETWDVYAQGRKVYSLQEARRTKEFVELRSPTHALWIRLRDDASWVLDPTRGASDWQKQYAGGWRDRPLGATVQPGAPMPVVPTGPVALLRTVPEVLGLTREAADKAIRAAGLVPVFQLLPGGAGDSTRVVAQSPTRGATLAAGGRVTVRYRSAYPMQQPVTPGPQATGPGARTFWTYAAGHFIKRGDGTWEVYASGRKVFALQEARRTPEFVELRSPQHALWVRLRADSSWVLDPSRGASDWQKQYDGQWRAHPDGGR